MISLILTGLGMVVFLHLISITLILRIHSDKLRSARISKNWKEADKLMANTPTFFYGRKDIRSKVWLEMNKRAGWK